MNYKRTFLFLAAGLFMPMISACKNENIEINQFLKSDDILVIKTTKHRGNGPFQFGAGNLQFKDTSEILSPSIKVPLNINEVKRLQLKVDFKEKERHFVEIVKGSIDGKQIIIVDENNNNDLTDDLIREYRKIDWEPDADLIKCEYLISNGNQIVKDSSWLNIGYSNGTFFIGRSEHLKGRFEIENEEYEIGINEPRNTLSFTYNIGPEIVLLNNMGQIKDSVSERDLLVQGEFLNLNGKYYRFEDISNTGDSITLIKEKKFESKIGTQVGMIHPTFEVISTAKDTIYSSDLLNKLTVIANSCGCGGDVKSTQAFYEMEKLLGDEMNILHVDSKIEKSNPGIHIDSEEKFNRNFFNNYRKEYCSRMCYVIGKNKRIIDKFNIFEWKRILPKITE